MCLDVPRPQVSAGVYAKPQNLTTPKPLPAGALLSHKHLQLYTFTIEHHDDPKTCAQMSLGHKYLPAYTLNHRISPPLKPLPAGALLSHKHLQLYTFTIEHHDDPKTCAQMSLGHKYLPAYTLNHRISPPLKPLPAGALLSHKHLQLYYLHHRTSR